jgi:hypothetical protein
MYAGFQPLYELIAATNLGGVVKLAEKLSVVQLLVTLLVMMSVSNV